MRTYRFRIYPTDLQVAALNITLDLCRELYNAMLQQRIYAYRSGRKINYNSQPEFTPVEIGALPAMATPVAETGSPLR